MCVLVELQRLLSLGLSAAESDVIASCPTTAGHAARARVVWPACHVDPSIIGRTYTYTVYSVVVAQCCVSVRTATRDLNA